MSERDDAYLEQLRQDAAAARTLFSNTRKPDRERMVVRAFLRSAGIPFTEDDIRAVTEEPIDVTFKTARFQIMDMVGERKRGLFWKLRQQLYDRAKTISDLSEPWRNSEPMALPDAAHVVAADLAGKAARYGAKTCSQLDALVYVDFGGRHLWPLDAPMADATAQLLRAQGWRSVSMLFVPYAVVLSTQPGAPDFLNERTGQILREWAGPDGWFDP